MKKFLLTLSLLLAFAIIIPTTASVEAANVPNFLQVAGNHVRYTGVENNRKKNNRSYRYECSLDLRESFAEQYVNLLRQSGFTLINHEVNDWRRLNPPRYLDKWILRYSGQQVEIWKYQYFEQGRKSFSIVVPNGLSYGGY